MDRKDLKEFVGVAALIVCCAFSVTCMVFGCIVAAKKFNVWTARKEGEAEYAKAESTRRIKILESLATLESAKNHASSEIERAKGMAEANKIVGSSLTNNENYLKYLWIQAMEHTCGQVIYVPTEAGLPILEAGKRR